MRKDIEKVTSVGCSKTEPTGSVSLGRQVHMRQYGYTDSDSGKGSGATREYMREGPWISVPRQSSGTGSINRFIT